MRTNRKSLGEGRAGFRGSRAGMAFCLAALLTSFFPVFQVCRGSEDRPLHLAQGIWAGEVTATSVILQTRLTATPGLDETGDVPGADGVVRFEIAASPGFEGSRQTSWSRVSAASDWIAKAFVDGLQAHTRYWYRASFGANPGAARSQSGLGTFQTLPAATDDVPVNFVLTSCLNYAFFRHGKQGRGGGAGADRDLGYPALEPMAKLAPGFVVIDGDCVYYDHPAATAAKTLGQMRKKWHEQYVMPRLVSLLGGTASYWLKDDHDHRKNDCDPSGAYEPSHELGMATFREQAPVVNPAGATDVTYRTHRVGRHLQLWLTEGRDHRSPNAMADGPEKSLWGAEQRAWLQRTLLESDATFQILLSPTPLIGPDDGSKADNHTNPRGFKHEGESFFAWLGAHHIPADRFFIICGDRHWKYHSQHETGFEELTCGTLHRENARLGRAPGDPKSTDPGARVKQFYTDSRPCGGFLQVTVTSVDKGSGAEVHFQQYDETGGLLHEHKRRQTVKERGG